MTGAARLVLRCYPPSFRARYGDELAALVDELPASPRRTMDLAFGAARAWVAPRFGGDDGVRLRMQASVSTTWAAWCIGFLVAPAMSKALLDPLGAGTPPVVPILVGVGSVAFAVGWLVAAIGIVCVLAGGVVAAARARTRRVAGPLLVPLVLGVLSIGGLLALAVVARSDAVPSGMARGALVAWALLAGAFIVALAAGPATSLRRAVVSARGLRLATMLAPVLAGALVVCTAAGAAAALIARDGALLGSAVPVTVVLLAAGTSAVVAVVSAARGVGVIRARG